MQYRAGDRSMAQFGFAVSEPTIICKLEMPHDNLEALAAFEAEASAVMKQLAEEKELREKNPSVQKAYEAYKVLLNLTQKESNELDN